MLQKVAMMKKGWRKTLLLLEEVEWSGVVCILQEPMGKCYFSDFLLLLSLCTKVEVFVEKRVCGPAQTAGANSRLSTTKKREISRTFSPINLYSLGYLSGGIFRYVCLPVSQ